MTPPQRPWYGADEESQKRTQAWTRSYTTHEALRRHGLLATTTTTTTTTTTNKQLCIHVVGTDVVEGDTVQSTVESFAPLCQLISEANTYTTIIIVLNGMDLLIPNGALSSDGVWLGRVSNIALKLIWCPGQYTEDLIEQHRLPCSDLVICFNAGLWGYDTWKETLAWIMSNQTPLVITSYTWKEADDDQHVMEEVMNQVNANGKTEDDAAITTYHDGAEPIIRWVWFAERNPYGSTTKRESYHLGEYLRDNSWWMSCASTLH